MEHSVLHAIQLIGLVLALGGPLLVLMVLRPALKALGPNPLAGTFAHDLEQNAVRWVRYGALGSALGTFVDLFVQTAELAGKTVFNGVDLLLAFRLAIQTTVGQLSLARIGVLVAVAIVVGRGKRPRWRAMLVVLAVAAGLTSMVSHAAAQPTQRAVWIATQGLHLLGGATWLGVLLHLLIARRLLENAHRPQALRLTAEMVRRFSPWAFTAVSVLFGSGLLSLCHFVGGVGALLTSPYGLTLLLKLMLIGLVLYAGYKNYDTIRPSLLWLAKATPQAGVSDHDFQQKACCVLRRFGRTLELEVTAGLLVITIAGILGSISPPGSPGVQSLTTRQTEALLSPHLPTMTFMNPAAFYGAPERTLPDLRYAEFTHNVSGALVCLLGFCFLTRNIRGSVQQAADHLWPAVLMLLGAFVLIASDPEIWWLHRVSFWHAVGDPQLLEHQLGAVMVFFLASLAWRRRRQSIGRELLGYVLPSVMIAGSLLLLGHAHSNLNAEQSLTNLINLQHAVFGTVGLLAGVTRWLVLRDLVPARPANWVWPALVIGLGLFMTFFYREVV